MILDITNVKYNEKYLIELFLKYRLKAFVDFHPIIGTRILTPLLDVNILKKFTLDGWSLAWPNEVDFAEEYLHEFANSKILTEE